MSSDDHDCSVSQENVIIPTNTELQICPSTSTCSNNGNDKNLVSVNEDISKIMAQPVSSLDCQHGSDNIAVVETKSDMMTSEMTEENHFINKQHNVFSSPDHAVSVVNISISSSHEPNISDCKDNTDNHSVNTTDETDSLHNKFSSSREVRNVTNSEHEEVEQVNCGIEIDQGGQQPHPSEVDMDVGENEHPQSWTTEAIEPIHHSLAFTGPVLPNYGVDNLEGYERTCLPGQDIPKMTSSDTQGDFIDDLRYNLSVDSVPRLTATTSSEFQGVSDNFLRGCKWSPDGNCVLTNSNDNCLRIFHPFDNRSTDELGDNKEIAAAVKMKECSQVYDFAWHPRMGLSHPEYCRIACTCSGIPIHLWDSTTGQIVANYRAYDQFDEITAAFSLSFSLDGRKIYAGYNKAIRIFDTDYPARSCKTIKTYNSQSKDGQTGIISCFTFSPDGNGLYVAGSYSRHIGMYDSACDKLVCLMQGQHGGVTHLMFSPDGTKLYSGGRKDAEILCWDMRNMDKILFSALRDVKTNQRIYFDLSQSGRYLVSGNHDGTVAFWDTLSSIEEINGDSFLKPCSQFQAHGDCVNGVSFNHQKNMVATASGQRHFSNFDYDSSDSAEDESAEAAEAWDYSLRLWQIPLLQL